MIIYKLTSPSNNSYIGLTEKELSHRLNQHCNEAKYKKTMLNKALSKYPIDQWNIEILEECENRDQLIEKEKYYINEFDTYNNGYNMTLGGDGVDPETASKLRSEYFESDEGKEWKRELSKRLKENNINNGQWKGKKHTEESKKKNSEAHKGKKHTEEQVANHSLEMKKRWESGIYDKRKNPDKEGMIARGMTMKGKKQSDNQKRKVAEKLSANWEVQFPSGEIEIVNNLNAFCREYNLDPANLKRTQPNGNQKQHKGFVLIRKVDL